MQGVERSTSHSMLQIKPFHNKILPCRGAVLCSILKQRKLKWSHDNMDKRDEYAPICPLLVMGAHQIYNHTEKILYTAFITKGLPKQSNAIQLAYIIDNPGTGKSSHKLLLHQFRLICCNKPRISDEK